MFGEQRTRTLMKAADPIQAAAAPSRRRSATDLIARAEATPEPTSGRRPRPTRRLVLVAGAMAVLIGGAAVIDQLRTSAVDGPRATVGMVLVPIAYEIEDDPPPAADRLRALAGRLADAPYDSRTGQYAYHRTKSWGDPLLTSEGGRYVLGYVSERETWRLADGSGRGRVTRLPPEFPDSRSRDYWQRELPAALLEDTQEETLPPESPESVVPLPADRAGLADLLQVRHGGGEVAKPLVMVYTQYVVPKQTRALVLDILADIPGFTWRGQVTDRAGRTGLAITYEHLEPGQQTLLIFDAQTGVLLAHEIVSVEPRRVSTYLVVLDTDRTDQVG